MSNLTSQQQAALKDQLLRSKQSVEQRLQQADHYGLGHSLRDNTGELSGIDNHPADIASELYEREKDISLNEHDEILLERIDTALQQMERGTYGICVVCGQPIPFERLEAIPSTMYCIKDYPEHFVSHGRPVEEQVLQPPFGRTSFDEVETQNGFDGEDAWQIVEAWGTSNTPAMQEGNDIDSYDRMYIEASEELDGFVEPFESFIATDLTGRHVSVIRNKTYKRYMSAGEGEPLLEPDVYANVDDLDDRNSVYE
ncbi:TraR/DksA C4-type zinc finger protein [Paenibacillus sp. 481]|uniref:TraR/DksA C4-type zinc finger protein n=1 Tax=Paenibacillus sp. 481 TaxID=2835869 RepID=UPI001E455C5B|nr:TraR/DksA C4-type zinc finger protein [Paenibacillus sp. 481]UHA74109.1 TraR/DksA C4-type zinc finger protein [Paenibacillus sp. 481]